ncbi:MAG: hypothetical protein MK052_08410 [Alphaproteobacteria bacterium]|nr:hypothetical protein [Alphaproteobacteria bacterium]
MIPTLSAPNIQVAPPADTSIFTGQNADAALGRLPVVTVPPTVTNAKVADDNRSQTQQRNPQNTPPQNAAKSGITPFSLSGSGELAFESPYSTTFVAQLFGQFQLDDSSLADLAGETTDIPLGFVNFDRLSQVDVTKYMPSFAFGPRTDTVEPQPSQSASTTPVAAPPRENITPEVVPVAASQPQAVASEVASTVAQVSAEALQDTQPVTAQNNADALTTPSAAPQPSQLSEAQTNNASLLQYGTNNAYSSTQSRNMVNLATDSRGSGSEISLIS